MSKELTAMQIAISKFNEYYIVKDKRLFEKIKNELLETEKKQIIDAYDAGATNDIINRTGEKYYNQKYKP